MIPKQHRLLQTLVKAAQAVPEGEEAPFIAMGSLGTVVRTEAASARPS